MTNHEIYERCGYNHVTGCRTWRGKQYVEPLFDDRTSVRQAVLRNAERKVPEGQQPYAACGNPKCVAEEHIDFCVSKNRYVGGGIMLPERGRNRPLAEEDALKIHQMYRRGVAKEAIADEVGCGWQTVNNVLAFRTHRQLKRVLERSAALE